MRNNTIQHRYNRDCSRSSRSHLSSYLPKAFWPVFAFITVFLGLSFAANAADTIRVNIPRVTVTMARNYNFTSAANSVYVPVEFNSTMSADKVADYIEESNVFLFDHYGEDVVEIGGVSDDFGTIYLDIKPNTGIKRDLLITSTSSDSKVITVVQAGDTPEPEPEPEPEPDEKFNIPGNWKMVRHYTDETGNNYITDITFYDGLGYPSQIVNVGASPTGNRNIVTPIVYDRMRRSDSVLFLPYASATVNTIKEESAPLQGQSSFYGSMFGTGESSYAKTRRVYEPSELNRLSQEYKPGSAYTSKHVSYSYETNSANEVFNLRVNSSTGAMHTDSSYPYYDVGTLFKDVATDEDGKVFTTYKDVAGRLIMEKRGTDSKTYYVYDDRGFLSWVVTPAGSALLSSSANWSKTSANAVNHCYIYNHDYRGNITEKSIPGAGTSEYVYDKGGRLVLERDANLKGKNRWIYHVYDNIGREIECNLVQGTSSVTRASAQTKYDNISPDNSYPQLGGGTPDTPPSIVGNFTLICKLSQTRFGGGVYRTASSTQTSSFTVPAYLAFSPVSGVAESVDLDNVKIIGYKLYEKIALLDGSENGNTGNTSYIERAFHYDRKGRVMQVVEKNSTGGISRTSAKYDFRGNILAVNENHSAGSLTITKGTVYSYDQRGRMLSERVSVNGVEKATVNYSYDALGNLTEKSYGNGVTDNLQYNIQGWGTVSQTVKGSETLYSQRLRYYDAEKGSGLYNGNISEWRMQQGTNAASTYRYSYDGLGRLTESSRYAGTATSATNSWCEKGIDYDLNGNIVTLQRFGSSASAAEDNLLYGYTGNRLIALTGSSKGTALNASYSYDAGGNMLYDGRRGLGISYNILNLPAKVVEKAGTTAADGAVKAEYLYSADGIKQRVVDATDSNGYLYLGTLVLSKDGESYTLSSTGFGGGRIIGGAGNSCLAYYYGTDHLGSVRVITDSSGSVVERNDYYPMGMRTATGNSYPQLTTNLYKYNGKELQTVGGLGFTDYGARMYDDFTGRWFVPDPLAEKYASMSPYMYCGGNPIMFFDKDGKIWDTFIDVGFLIYDVGSAIYYHATGEHETAKGYWVDAGIDAVAAAIPFVPAGVTKLPKLIGKGSNAIEKSVDISKTAKVIDKTSDVKKVAIKKETVTSVSNIVDKTSSAHKGLTNEELVIKAANKANKAIPGIGSVVGTKKHVYAEELIDRYQMIFGDRGLKTNEYFNKGSGKRGYLDVHDTKNNIIYDFKFGKNPHMKQRQINKYMESFPGSIVVPVKVPLLP